MVYKQMPKKTTPSRLTNLMPQKTCMETNGSFRIDVIELYEQPTG